MFYKIVRHRYPEELNLVHVGINEDLPSLFFDMNAKEMFKLGQARLMEWAGILSSGIEV